jgi:hypothetical protein
VSQWLRDRYCRALHLVCIPHQKSHLPQQ